MSNLQDKPADFSRTVMRRMMRRMRKARMDLERVIRLILGQRGRIFVTG